MKQANPSRAFVADAAIGELPGSPNRLASLDGLRGVAALIVVLHHFCCAFFPWLMPDLTPHPYWIIETPLGIFLQGAFSVSVFFVLSGFVVARAASRSRDSIVSNLIARYVRLAVPVTVSVVFAWGLLTLLPEAATQLNEVRPSPWLTLTMQHSIPGLWRAMTYGFFGAFGRDPFHLHAAPVTFNNALWTMRVELDGSVGIYLFYAFRRSFVRWIVLAAVAFETVRHPLFLGFILGAWMMEAWSKGTLPRRFAVTAFVAGILLGFPGEGFARFGVGHLPMLVRPGNKDGLVAPIAAALILYGVLNSKALTHWFSSRIPNFLGRVSFPMYLVHVPLLYTVCAFAYLKCFRTVPYVVPLILVGFLVVTLSLATAGEILVDAPLLRAIRSTKKRLRSAGHAEQQQAAEATG